MYNEMDIIRSVKDTAIRFENKPEELIIFLKNSMKTSGKTNYYAISGYAYYLTSLGYSKLAFPVTEEALKHFISIGDLNGEGGCYITMGIIHRNLGNLLEARDLFLKSIDVFIQTKSISDQLVGYVNLGSILSDLGEFDQGIKSQEIILDKIKYIEESKENKSTLGRCYGNLANLYRHIGEFQKSIDYQKQSLAIAKKFDEKLDDKVEVAANYLELGETYRLIGKLDMALDNYNESLKIAWILGHKYGIANCLSNIGIIYRLQKDFQKSIDCHVEALKIRKEINDKFGIAKSYTNLGNVFGDTGDQEQAEKCLKSSLQYYEDLGNYSELAQAYISIGATYNQFNDPQKAINCYEKALQYCKKVGDKVSEMLIYHNLSSNYYEQEDYNLALEYAKKAILLEGLMREGLVREELSLTLLKSRFSTYFLAISSGIKLYENKMDQRYLKECLEIIERTKAREIIKKMNIKKKKGVSLIKEYKVLDEIENSLNILEAKIKKNPSIADIYALDELYTKKAKLLEEIYLKGLDTTSLIPSINLSIIDKFWENIVNYKNNILIIEMYLHESDIFFFMFNNKEYKLFIQNLSNEKRDFINKYFKLDLAKSGEFNKSIKELSNVLFPEDLIKELVKSELRDLIIIPHKWLHNIAWEAIDINGTPLGLEFNVVRHYSLDLVKSCLSLGKNGKNVALIVSNPNSDLEGAERECDIVAKQLEKYEKIILNKEKAILSSIKTILPEISIAHFSCHANFDKKDPLKSKLLLEDNALIANDIILLNLKNHPFIFLNACETGRMGGRTSERLEDVGDEQLGFIRAFSLAQASTIIVTSWKIRDDVAEYFAQVFYFTLKNKSLRESLREARKSTYLKYKENSHDWASYVLYGNPFREI